MDAYRAVEAVQSHPETDREQASAADSSGTGAAKEIEVYWFNNHEGGQEHDRMKQLLFLRKILG